MAGAQQRQNSSCNHMTPASANHCGGYGKAEGGHQTARSQDFVPLLIKDLKNIFFFLDSENIRGYKKVNKKFGKEKHFHFWR